MGEMNALREESKKDYEDKINKINVDGAQGEKAGIGKQTPKIEH